MASSQSAAAQGSRADGLAGTTIVLTRPAGSATAFARRVNALGADALLLPGLSLRAAPDVTATRAALRATRFDDWIFISPAAARFAFRLVPPSTLRAGSRVFGIGAGTRRALARHGIDAIVPSTTSDGEGLLALPQLADPRGRRAALIGAPGGRDLIAPELRRRGAQVESIHVYRRVPPRLTRRHFDALARAPDPLVTLLSSGEALANLVALVPPALLARLRSQLLVVSSERLAALARAHAFVAVTRADSAAADDLLDAARAALVPQRS